MDSSCLNSTSLPAQAPEEQSLEAQTILRLKRERDEATDKLDAIREALPDDSPSHRADITGQTMAEDVADLVKANDKFQKVCADYHTRLSEQVAYAVALQRIVESLHAGAPIVGDKCPHHAKLAEKIRSLYEATKSRAESAEARVKVLEGELAEAKRRANESAEKFLVRDLWASDVIEFYRLTREDGDDCFATVAKFIKKQLTAPAWIPVSTPPTPSDGAQIIWGNSRGMWVGFWNDNHASSQYPPTHWQRFPLPPTSPPEEETEIEQACIVMHDAYEEAARCAGWKTQIASRKPWVDVPEANKVTMRASVKALLAWQAARQSTPTEV